MDAKIAHLQMIQSVITRMGSNSFLLKGWSVTLIAALFALAAAGTNPLFLLLAYFTSFMFWGLDAYFLRQERLFRKLYEHVQEVSAPEIDFSMDTAPFNGAVDPQFKVAFSETLGVFHGTIVATIVVVMIVLFLKQ